MSDGSDENTPTPADLLGDPIKPDTAPRRRTPRSEADNELLRQFLAANRAAAAAKTEEPKPATEPPPQTSSSHPSPNAVIISVLTAPASASLIQVLAHLVPGERWLVNPYFLSAISLLVSPVCALRPNRLTITLLGSIILLVIVSLGYAAWPKFSPYFDGGAKVESAPPATTPITSLPDPKQDAEQKREDLFKQCEEDKQGLLGQTNINVAAAKKALAACHAKPITFGQVLAVTPRCKHEGEALIRAERARWFAKRRDCSLSAAR